MRRSLLIVVVALLYTSAVSGQVYFDHYYSNIADFSSHNYVVACMDVRGWLFSGKYYPAEKCTNCSVLADNGKIKPNQIDSLHNAFMKIYPARERDTLRAPVEITVKEPGKEPYAIYTSYKLEGNNLEPILQVKITFAKTKHNGMPDVKDITFIAKDKFKSFDKKGVIKAYKQAQKELEDAGPPPVMELK